MNQANLFTQGIRVANFSSMDLSAVNRLDFSTMDTTAVIREIRRHADLPYVFVVSAPQAKLAGEVVASLKAMRSPCVPYALFLLDDASPAVDGTDVEIFSVDGASAETLQARIDAYANDRLRVDPDTLRIGSSEALPPTADVAIVGGGITGLYAANRLRQSGISFVILEKHDRIGGIWSQYANATSRVNSSECAYRVREEKTRTNRDHSATREILEDMAYLANEISDRLFLHTEVGRIEKSMDGYRISYVRDGSTSVLESKGVILAINDRVGSPREIEWENQAAFGGEIVAGISDNAAGVDWQDKNVVVVGMGAFATENARTALEGGARHVTAVCRRHGTVCPKIIDYLNFATPYDAAFKHDKKSNFRNMMYWKKMYELSGATQPECWMGKVKHEGHTISVSDIWFVAHHLKKIATVTGAITGMTETGVVVSDGRHIEADVVVNCVGFERNGSLAKALCGYAETTNINFVDKDFMYLADAYIDDDAFNSFFGSSVLEMAKFYMEVYVRCFNRPEYDRLIATAGIERIPIDDRRWSHYINGAMALINNHPELYEVAKSQVDARTRNFLEKHDLESYIEENKREWIDLHTLLAGRPMTETECLPYVFDKLLPQES